MMRTRMTMPVPTSLPKCGFIRSCEQRRRSRASGDSMERGPDLPNEPLPDFRGFVRATRMKTWSCSLVATRSGVGQSQHLIVDGANIVHAWPDLRRMAVHDRPGARDRLAQLLTSIHDSGDIRLTLVFDGR